MYEYVILHVRFWLRVHTNNNPKHYSTLDDRKRQLWPCEKICSHFSLVCVPLLLLSMGSFSKAMLQVGPMISSKKMTWIGEKMLGYFHPNNNGKVTMDIRICIEIIYWIAFLNWNKFSAQSNCSNHVAKIIINQNQWCSLSRDFTSSLSHSDSNVRSFQCRTIIHSITGHGNHFSVFFKAWMTRNFASGNMRAKYIFTFSLLPASVRQSCSLSGTGQTLLRMLYSNLSGNTFCCFRKISWSSSRWCRHDENSGSHPRCSFCGSLKSDQLRNSHLNWSEVGPSVFIHFSLQQVHDILSRPFLPQLILPSFYFFESRLFLPSGAPLQAINRFPFRLRKYVIIGLIPKADIHESFYIVWTNENFQVLHKRATIAFSIGSNGSGSMRDGHIPESHPLHRFHVLHPLGKFYWLRCIYFNKHHFIFSQCSGFVYTNNCSRTQRFHTVWGCLVSTFILIIR